MRKHSAQVTTPLIEVALRGTLTEAQARGRNYVDRPAGPGGPPHLSLGVGGLAALARALFRRRFAAGGSDRGARSHRFLNTFLGLLGLMAASEPPGQVGVIEDGQLLLAEDANGGVHVVRGNGQGRPTQRLNQ